ncbi:hypothetical protein BD410DRAFT_461861 [Rickenella mellea]|uniref:Uncharacterized protein n=1 Tax=Rickenella mellea TaxID=50990 RepID=A0A4Y7PUY3_9AGAM|nr:hypothetical protein BD410DRAFT_461861 [Rickenella mellea]
MELAILSTSWKLVRAITEILDRLEQTREDARSLKYLENQAKTFLTIVTDGLTGVDPAPYRETIASLELLYKDILTTSEKYILDGKIKQMWKASKTRKNILNLNRRMRLFIDTYLLQVATETARLNLRAFAEPPPPLPPISTSSENAMWKVMSWSNGATTGDRTSTKQLPVVSDPMNPLLMPRHSQNTTHSMAPAESHPWTSSDSTSQPHADPSRMSTPDQDQNPGTNTSMGTEAASRAYMPSPPPPPPPTRGSHEPPSPPPPSATHLRTPAAPHPYADSGGSSPRDLGPFISADGLIGYTLDTRMPSESTASAGNPWVPSTSTPMPLDQDSEPPVPSPDTDTPTTESIRPQTDDDRNSHPESLKAPSSADNDSSSAKPGNAEDMLLRFFNALGQHLSEGSSSSSPSSPSPPPTLPQTPITPRRPGFDRRLEAQRDCELQFYRQYQQCMVIFQKR